MTCPECGTGASDGAAFCGECGTAFVGGCPGCGAPTSPRLKFCEQCGTALTPVPHRGLPRPSGPDASVPVAERRWVSVLFADLVGFTAVSEVRDAEDVRELLTAYFDTCRTIIVRYGGTVEKFIGDAVMAVWGTPVANEDDAERAVRAALDLVAAVEALGSDNGAPGLAARAGVLSGEAAVTLGATGQGLVAGDLVNTASRIQSAALPGGVLVGETTKFATESAVVYDDAGLHELKGKAEPQHLHRALRVVSMRSGGQRASGLEAPFVGRAAELRTVRDLMHATADRSSAHLASITGVAGVGKSRLSWELEKYVDGLVERFWWHRGRCLAYGEGVAFSALAEMVRSRAGIVEGEDPDRARAKLSAALVEHVPDEAERRWVEPRLRQLLALGEAASTGQDDAFAAWRLFFERMSDSSPVVMVFEDLQWADAGLLDFVEYLLDWSRKHPLFVLTLARPELLERRPAWGASRRNVSSLYLDPLSDEAMRELISGLVPGLAGAVVGAVLDRAAGVPLYAVETVRMMLDRGLLAPDGDGYRTTGAVDDLEVPPTLHALVAARLDTLGPVPRRLLGDAAVLGQSFSEEALSTVSGEDPAVVREAVEVLQRREILERTSDPRSPERGQLQFVQDLLQLVAYDTLSRRDRRDRHLAVAEYLERTGGEDTIEVQAAHYVQALRLGPDDEHAAGLRDRTREILVRASDRVAALGSWGDAQRLLAKALPLASDAVETAELYERLGLAAYFCAELGLAREYFGRSIDAFAGADRPRDAARAAARLGDVDVAERGYQSAITRMRAALEVLGAAGESGREVAALASQLGRVLYLSGAAEEAAPYLERALVVAEELADTETLSQALNTKSLLLLAQGRVVECQALLEQALVVARANDHHTAALRAHNNLAVLLEELEDPVASDRNYESGLDLARRVGNRFWEAALGQGQLPGLVRRGRWDDALELAALVPRDGTRPTSVEFLQVVPVHLARGDLAAAESVLAMMGDPAEEESAEVGGETLLAAAQTRRDRGDHAGAIAAARGAVALTVGDWQELAVRARSELVEAELADGRVDDADCAAEPMRTAPPGRRRPTGEARLCRLEGLIAAARGQEPAGLPEAASRFRDLQMPFEVAVCQVEHGEWLVATGRADEAVPVLREAREAFLALRATPWVTRAEQAAERTTGGAARVAT